MLKLSVFTPSHNPEHLHRCYQSLVRQVHTDGIEWEWVVVLNGGAEYTSADSRVKVVHAPQGLKGVGALKRFAAGQCTGDVFIELDHDDELMPDAMTEIATAARGNDNAFIFSPTIELDANGEDRLYGKGYGWEHGEYQGRKYNLQFPVTARSLCEIFFAPNHVRAWTRSAYAASGGHSPDLHVCDDQDVIIRTYLAGVSFIQLPHPVYIQRLTSVSTQFKQNRDIQSKQAELRDANVGKLAVEWARREGLACYDLGGAHGCPPGFIPIDQHPCDGIQWDIAASQLGFAPANSVGVIRASDFLEHIPIGKVVPLMNDIYRVLAPGGWLLSNTPSTDGRGAFQDPTHCSFWSSNSFWYYTRAQQAKYVPEIKARFQAVTLDNVFPSEWHKTHNIPYVVANLSALKGQRQPGMCEI